MGKILNDVCFSRDGKETTLAIADTEQRQQAIAEGSSNEQGQSRAEAKGQKGQKILDNGCFDGTESDL